MLIIPTLFRPLQLIQLTFHFDSPPSSPPPPPLPPPLLRPPPSAASAAQRLWVVWTSVVHHHFSLYSFWILVLLHLVLIAFTSLQRTQLCVSLVRCLSLHFYSLRQFTATRVNPLHPDTLSPYKLPDVRNHTHTSSSDPLTFSFRFITWRVSQIQNQHSD